MKMLPLMLAAVASFSATAAMAQGAPAPADFVKQAGASDLYEQQSSKLVLATTKDPKVREFATMMVSDHMKSTAMVKSAAMESDVKPMPPKLMPEQATMIADLKKAKGPARDAAYVEQQKMAHQKALALHSGYAETGTAPALKAAAAQIVPVVQHHVDMLAAM